MYKVLLQIQHNQLLKHKTHALLDYFFWRSTLLLLFLEVKGNVPLRWCDQKTINLARTQTVFWKKTFHAFVVPTGEQRAAWTQPHVKRAGQSGEGWLIALQSLSGSPDKENARLPSAIKMLNSHSRLQRHAGREKMSTYLFGWKIVHTAQQSGSQDFVLCLWRPNNAIVFILLCWAGRKSTAEQRRLGHCSWKEC